MLGIFLDKLKMCQEKTKGLECVEINSECIQLVKKKSKCCEYVETKSTTTYTFKMIRQNSDTF